MWWFWSVFMVTCIGCYKCGELGKVFYVRLPGDYTSKVPGWGLLWCNDRLWAIVMTQRGEDSDRCCHRGVLRRGLRDQAWADRQWVVTLAPSWTELTGLPVIQTLIRTGWDLQRSNLASPPSPPSLGTITEPRVWMGGWRLTACVLLAAQSL